MFPRLKIVTTTDILIWAKIYKKKLIQNSFFSLKIIIVNLFFLYTLFLATCGGTINSNNGMIQSPGYPMLYENNVECTWMIEVESTKAITFRWQTQYHTHVPIAIPYQCTYINTYQCTYIIMMTMRSELFSIYNI